MKTLYDFDYIDEKGKTQDMSQYRGKVLLIVNTASKCGFTPQYKGLEALHKRFGEQGFTVLGFPCNQFGRQEPGTMEEVREFCDTHFQISFPLASKCEVNGSNTLPVYRYLKTEAPGVLGSRGIKWNFTKFLVNRQGRVVRRFAPLVKPDAIARDILPLL